MSYYKGLIQYLLIKEKCAFWKPSDHELDKKKKVTGESSESVNFHIFVLLTRAKITQHAGSHLDHETEIVLYFSVFPTRSKCAACARLLKVSSC